MGIPVERVYGSESARRQQPSPVSDRMSIGTGELNSLALSEVGGGSFSEVSLIWCKRPESGSRFWLTGMSSGIRRSSTGTRGVYVAGLGEILESSDWKAGPHSYQLTLGVELGRLC